MKKLFYLLPLFVIGTLDAKSKKFQQLSDEVNVEEVTLNIDENTAAIAAFKHQKSLNLTYDYVILESVETMNFEVIDINPKIVSMPTSGPSLVPVIKKETTRFTYKVADNNIKDIYVKECRLCHGNNKKLFKRYKQKVWEKAFEDDGARLVKVHDKSNILKLTHGYFKSRDFLMQLEPLKEYILSSNQK